MKIDARCPFCDTPVTVVRAPANLKWIIVHENEHCIFPHKSRAVARNALKDGK